MSTPEPDQPVNKGTIINHLIARGGFTSYLEYNKFDGASYFDDIRCANKTLAYLPEHSYLDGPNLRRLLKCAERADIEQILPLETLLARYAGQQFDLIFFDPVHVRPDVDLALQTLPRLLKPGGILVVHDCNPAHVELTSLQRRPGAWVGETYKAFALFRHFNRGQCVTVDEDFGVGIIHNDRLKLDYAIDFDLDFVDFERDRSEYVGLIDHAHFLARTAGSDFAPLFAQPPKRQSIRLRAHHHPTPTTTRLPGPVSGRREAQLFWQVPGHGFELAAAATQYYQLDDGAQRLSFTLANDVKVVQRLRFDFADASASVRLNSMRLCAPDREIVWELARQENILIDPRDCAVVRLAAHDAPCLLFTAEHDPRLQLNLPDYVMRQLGAGWQVQVALTPLSPFEHALLVEFLGAAMPGKDPSMRWLTVEQSALLAQAGQLHQQHRQSERHIARLNKLLAEWRGALD